MTSPTLVDLCRSHCPPPPTLLPPSICLLHPPLLLPFCLQLTPPPHASCCGPVSCLLTCPPHIFRQLHLLSSCTFYSCHLYLIVVSPSSQEVPLTTTTSRANKSVACATPSAAHASCIFPLCSHFSACRTIRMCHGVTLLSPPPSRPDHLLLVRHPIVGYSPSWLPTLDCRNHHCH